MTGQELSNEMSGHQFIYIPLAIALLVVVLPVRTILNKCFDLDDILSNSTQYKDRYPFFFTDYDRENPVTHKQGVVRLIESRIATASGDDKTRLE